MIRLGGGAFVARRSAIEQARLGSDAASRCSVGLGHTQPIQTRNCPRFSTRDTPQSASPVTPFDACPGMDADESASLLRGDAFSDQLRECLTPGVVRLWPSATHRNSPISWVLRRSPDSAPVSGGQYWTGPDTPAIGVRREELGGAELDDRPLARPPRLRRAAQTRGACQAGRDTSFH